MVKHPLIMDLAWFHLTVLPHSIKAFINQLTDGAVTTGPSLLPARCHMSYASMREI